MALEMELMSTEGCHLCEQAIAVLQQALGSADVTVDWVDIAYDDALMAKYSTRIPVLVAGKNELDWPFGVEAVQAFAKSAAQPC